VRRDTGTPLFIRAGVKRAGELVSIGELMARVWPDTLVEESNLTVQVAAMRRVLRDGNDASRYISTVAGRAYWFVAPVALNYMNADAWDWGHSPRSGPLIAAATEISDDSSH
jgi:DNA-binding winged helix-turn-helix (wHTH) protein